jgi:chromosome segregation ATPase
LLRSKSVQPQQPTNTVDNNRLTAEVARLQQEYNKLKSESDRTLSQKQTEFGIIEAEVKRLNVIVNSNEGQFNALVRDNEVLLHDNQVFFNDINAYKQKEGDLQKIIQELEAKLGGKSSEAASTATLRMEFNTKEARYLDEIRVLKQDKTTLERDLLGRQSSQ